MLLYICPDCRTPLDVLRCTTCQARFEETAGVPNLLPRNPKYEAPRLSAAYQAIYTNRTRVWEDQGRTPQFIEYFARLARQYSSGRILEIGCGEGFLLAALAGAEKFATDLSATALRRAQQRSQASGCVALAERLPYADESFDLVASVGVMEHFLFDMEATAEIHRVLRRGGHYIALIHVRQGVAARIGQKMREYVLPRPHPIAFAQWLWSKVHKPVTQPVQRGYTLESGRACLQNSGFALQQTISQRSEPQAPLIGPHVVIYVAQK
jgi:SAM-dependent methyltransferase